MLCIIPTLMVLSFFFNSRILQTGILQNGPNQFIENQKQNQDNTGRFGMKNLPKRLEFFCRNVLFPKKRTKNTPNQPVREHPAIELSPKSLCGAISLGRHPSYQRNSKNGPRDEETQKFAYVACAT